MPRLSRRGRHGARPPWPRSRPTCATSSCRRATARAGSERSCSPPRCATRCAPRRSPRSGSWPRPSGSSRRSGPRWSGSPATCGRPGARVEPLPDDEAALVRGVLDAVAAEHPAADDLLEFCREENARIEAFCREQDLIGLADEPLEIRWTPVFLRSFGGAMLIVAGAAGQGPEGVLRDHPDARRLDRRAARVEPARGQRPDAAPADASTRPSPATTCRASTPTAARRSSARSSRAGCSPRAGPST